MLSKGEGITLLRRRQGETSTICVLLTRQFGKMSMIAKGARTARSRFLGVLEPYQHIRFTGYFKEGRDLHYLSSAEIVRDFPALHNQLGKMSLAAVACEVIEKTEAPEHINPGLFTLTLDYLTALERGEKGVRNLLRAFLLRFCRLSGFEPALGQCRSCGRSETQGTVHFNLLGGYYFCARCAGIKGEGIDVSAEALELMRRLSGTPLASIAGGRTSADLGAEADRFLLIYLRHHIEELGNLKTIEYLRQLQNGLGN